jgi:hypothetical protein
MKMTHRFDPWQREQPARWSKCGPAPGTKYRPRTRPTFKTAITKPMESKRAERRRSTILKLRLQIHRRGA